VVKLVPFRIIDADRVAIRSDGTFMFPMTVICEEAARYRRHGVRLGQISHDLVWGYS